ncbi:uncharacterized protein LOC131285239 [Anopheles ziemanni]|uniref:uncharacterized protein LOC131285239 n=1 Tax=Anopheles ziemanni TaxID=345580 RepID=UPI00265D90CE|nr:uncharacterized protein LOC131285239 [Anopheles ziemanni]
MNILLKHLGEKALALIVNIFNKCMKLGHFPNTWKSSKVLPILKPGKDPTLPVSYRPISLLSSLSKVFERLLHRRLRDAVDERGIIKPEQFGFRPGHSTTHQLVCLRNNIQHHRAVSKTTAMVLLDVEKAFDNVWHDSLIHKMAMFGLPRHLTKLIQSYRRDEPSASFWEQHHPAFPKHRPESLREAFWVPCLPGIIVDLKNAFGRPLKLLKSMLDQVRKAANLDEMHPETFISFGIKVKQLKDHLVAGELRDHLNNPLLVDELVEKLPPSYRREWIRFRSASNEPAVSLFSRFMETVTAEAAEIAEYGVNPTHRPKYQPAVESMKKRVCQNCGNVGHEAQKCSANKSGPRCFASNGLGHRAKECTKKQQKDKFKCGIVGHQARNCGNSYAVECAGAKAEGSSKRKLPTIQVTCENKEFEALADTGSEEKTFSRSCQQNPRCGKIRNER